MSGPFAWRPLLEAFAAGRMDAASFETAFLSAWRSDRDEHRRTPFAVDTLFYEVDACCADPVLRGAQDIGEAELLTATKKALAGFDAPWPERPRHRRDEQMLDDVRRAAEDLFGGSVRDVR